MLHPLLCMEGLLGGVGGVGGGVGLLHGLEPVAGLFGDVAACLLVASFSSRSLLLLSVLFSWCVPSFHSTTQKILSDHFTLYLLMTASYRACLALEALPFLKTRFPMHFPFFLLKSLPQRDLMRLRFTNDVPFLTPHRGPILHVVIAFIL